MDEIRVYGASNLNDAFNNPLEILRTKYDVNFKSSSILSQRLRVEESNRDLTRMVFNLNDFSTAPANPRIPTDEEVCFIRLRGRMKATGELTDFGPVLDDTDSLYVSCAPGMSPTIIRPLDTLGITGGAVPEFFLAGDGATPQFTIRASLVNRG